MHEHRLSPDRGIAARAPERCPAGAASAEPSARRVGERLWEAAFELALSGMRGARRGPETGERQPAGLGPEEALRAVLAALAPGQDLILTLSWSPSAGGGHGFEWRARGSATDSRRKGAVAGAAALRLGLWEMLDAVGLELAPDAGAPDNAAERLTWRRTLAPRGIVLAALAGHPPGFTTRHEPAGGLVLSLPDGSRAGALDALTRAGGVAGRSLALCASFRPVALSPAQLARLRAARDALYRGPLEAVGREDGAGTPLLEPGLAVRLLERLERWLAEPRGYRLTCTLAADRPLSEAAAALIAAGIWGQSAWMLRDQPAARAPMAGHVLLADCIHADEAPPALIPGPEAREVLGVPRVYPPPSRGLPAEGLLLGRCGAAERPRGVRIAETDRQRHCYIIGATGSGKSSLLRQMVVQDMERGAGLCLIDPHGDLFEEVLQSVPRERADDVVLMDLTDFDHCVGLNFLECGGPRQGLQMNFIVNEMMSILGRLYNLELTGGPMFESYMRNALLTVMDDETRIATLMDVVRFFEDEGFRSRAIRRCGNPIGASFWDKQALKVKGDQSFANMAPYITSKLNQFTHNALLRPIIGQTRSTIDFRQAMDSGRIVLVNLAKGLLGELDMRLLGMLLVGKIVNAAMGRVNLPRARRRPFYLYIDEFQTLATPTVVGLLSEARKFGLSLIMANQHLAQLTEGGDARGVAEAILGNVATMLMFRIGHRDAAELEAYTRPQLDAHDLQRLPDRHLVCRMMRDNVPIDPFVMTTLPIGAGGGGRHASPEAIRERVRAEHTQARAEVDARIMRAWGRPERDPDYDLDCDLPF